MHIGNHIQEYLEALVGNQPSGIAVYCYSAGQYSTAAVNDFSIDDPVPTGCLAKALTASLLGIALAEGKIRLDDSLCDFFDCDVVADNIAGKLRAIRIFHLLNHSSGLDHSDWPVLPRTLSGFIDIWAILLSLRSSHFRSSPGTAFSYSSIGPWLAAATLEYSYGTPYIALLEKYLVGPLRLDIDLSREGMRLCPATGHDLKLSARDLMKLALAHMHGLPDKPSWQKSFQILRSEHPVQLKHLALKETVAYPGWFDFGGSFGQWGDGDKSAGAVRFFPDRDIVIAVTATHRQLANAALAAFCQDNGRDKLSLRPETLRSKPVTGPVLESG